jgi:dolichol kinase
MIIHIITIIVFALSELFELIPEQLNGKVGPVINPTLNRIEHNNEQNPTIEDNMAP